MAIIGSKAWADEMIGAYGLDIAVYGIAGLLIVIGLIGLLGGTAVTVAKVAL